jgi:site-specific recombinase XerD
MSLLAPTLQAFFTDRLARQRQASARTVAAYRDTFRLLLTYVQQQIGKAPFTLGFEHLDASVIVAFLNYLEGDRHNSARTRNARLAAVRSFFRYAALRHPEHAAVIQQVLAIPQKRFDRPVISFLTQTENDALVAAPDRSTWEGRRDYGLLVLVAQTGLRVSELTGLNCADVMLGTGAYVRCHGKGRKERLTPLTTSTAATLRVWLAERAGRPDDPVFPTRTGRRLSRDAVQRRIAKHAAVAERRSPSLQSKHLSPHVLRHTAAMRLLHAGVDTSVIALWLGHEDIRSTQMYLHADLTLKERALARTVPASVSPGRYRAPDPLVAFLESL